MTHMRFTLGLSALLAGSVLLASCGNEPSVSRIPPSTDYSAALEFDETPANKEEQEVPPGQ